MVRTAHNDYLTLKDFPDGELMGDRVLVRPDPVHETLAMIDHPNQRPHRGIVLRVGKGSFTKTGVRIPPAVEVGDKISFGPQAAQEVFLKDDYLLIVKEGSIFGVIT